MTEKTAQQKQIEQRLQNSLKGRRAKERRFVWFGRSAIAVAKADGRVDPEEVSLLHELAMALDLPKAYSNGIFAEESIALSK